MILSTSIVTRRCLSSLWRSSKPASSKEPVSPAEMVSEDQPGQDTYDRASVESLLQGLKKNAKLSNAKTYNPPHDVEKVIEKVVSSHMIAEEKSGGSSLNWRSLSLTNNRLKYKVLTEVGTQLGWDVPNFILSDIKHVEDMISYFKSPVSHSSLGDLQTNPLEKLGAMQRSGHLPPNMHVQVEYPGRVGDSQLVDDDDQRAKVYTGVDNVVTSLKYRRKYRGYLATIKEPLV